jgi:hypothetical protein
MSIISIFLCLPFAIPALINALRIDSLNAAGNFAGAEEASKKAKKWAIIAIVLGGAGVVLQVLVVIAGAAAQ